MPVTPIQRLQSVLKRANRIERAAFARLAGVGPTAISRVVAGQPVRAESYLRLCGAVGINSLTGEPAPSRPVGDIDWGMLALAVELRRRVRKIKSQRALARAIGGQVSHVTLSRFEKRKRVSAEHLVAVCRFLGIPPDHYCAEPERCHVKRTNETNEGRAA